jgi:putative DNA primase/helicase
MSATALSASWVAFQLGGDIRPNSAGWHRCRCPAHGGDALDTLALKDGDHGLAVKCFKGCRRPKVLNAIATLLLAGRFDRQVPATATSPPEPATDPTEFLRAAQRIWGETIPITGTPAEQRLRGRGITVALPDTLHFHRRLYHAGEGTCAPAMVAAVFDAAGEQRAIHRTWIDPGTGTTAAFTKPKMALCPTAGCAVRLGEPTTSVALTEGIETGLALMQLAGTGVPVWAALSAPGLCSIVLPEHVREVLIGADHDDAGLDAANALRARLTKEGRTVRVITPHTPGWDFNDELQHRGNR